MLNLSTAVDLPPDQQSSLSELALNILGRRLKVGLCLLLASGAQLLKKNSLMSNLLYTKETLHSVANTRLQSCTRQVEALAGGYRAWHLIE